uniref:Uncharacterized protein n=1 Tax=Romanomermis culicivorax TaxID=13658 RepID=A0A915K9J9_ROMCU
MDFTERLFPNIGDMKIIADKVRAEDQTPTDNGDDFANMVGKSDDQNQRSRVERESAWLSKIKADLVNNTKEREAYLTEIKTKFIDEIKSALTELTAANNSRINGIAKLVATPTSKAKEEVSASKKSASMAGGGPRDQGPPSDSRHAIDDAYGNSVAFCGIDGSIETGNY